MAHNYFLQIYGVEGLQCFFPQTAEKEDKQLKH